MCNTVKAKIFLLSQNCLQKENLCFQCVAHGLSAELFIVQQTVISVTLVLELH